MVRALTASITFLYVSYPSHRQWVRTTSVIHGICKTFFAPGVNKTISQDPCRTTPWSRDQIVRHQMYTVISGTPVVRDSTGQKLHSRTVHR